MNLTLRNLLKVFVLSLGMLSVGNLKAQYCIPDYTIGTGDGDYIDGVVLGDISNFSGMGDEYNDYTDLSTLLNPGSTYDLEVYNTPSWPENYAAWIDWNQDEVFSDDERLNPIDLELTAGGSDVITFTVPFTALPGTTRMRVMCVYFPALAIDPCGVVETYTFGEVEDYGINIPAAGPYDLGVTSISGLGTGCGLGVTPITVTVTNLGTEPSGAFSVAYQVDDPTLGALAPVVQAYTGAAIPSLGSVAFTFTTPADFSNLGEYTLQAYTIYGVDMVAADDTSDETFTNIPIVTTFPYYQDYEDGAGGWISGGTESTWELGDPAGFAIIGPPPATPTSLNSWTTELTDYYNLNEKSYVISPCLDFSSLIIPYMEFDANWDIQLYDDGAKLQYTTDEGLTWNDLGGIGTGDNWYNTNTCYAMWPTFYIDSYNGWSGNSGGWVHSKHDLSFLAGEPSVKFRFVFASSSYWNFNDGFAFDNMWIGDPLPNDIGVTNVISPETSPFLSATESVTVEVTNFGTNPQTGFPVSYQVDGGTIHTETFTGTLGVAEVATFTFSATSDLSADGDYDFVAWTGLASDEDVTNDTWSETISNIEPITGTNAYYIYSNSTGFEPWYTTSNSQHMDDVFGVGEWTTEYYETIDPAVLFSLDNCFIFMEGSDSHADAMETFINANMDAMQLWVAAGGHLLINAAPNVGDGMDFGFDGVHLDYPWYASTVSASDPTHPVWDGPFVPTSTDMTGFNYAHASISGAYLSPILFDAATPSRIICAERNYGAGTVIFGSMTVTDFHTPLTEAGNFRKNLIAYLATCTISNDDVGVYSIESPETGCGMTDEEIVTIKVKNYGFLPQTDVPVYYQADGGTIVSEVVPGTIGVGDVVLYTFATPVDISLIGDHTLNAWTGLPADTINDNDTTYSTLANIPVITTYPYYENWELGDEDGWMAYGASSTWELGYPDGPVINEPPTATPGSQYSWLTSITGNYNDNENSYLEGPCFDLSSLVIPYVEVDLWWETEDTWDGMQLEYSTNGGVTWSVLGDIGTGDNWYTNTAFALDYETGWVGSGGGWVTSHHDISFLAGETDVKFRFKFSADGIINFDGIGLDNFKVQDPWPNDVGVTDLITPVSGVDLTTTETVSVTVKNFGTLPQSGFPVNFQADAGTIHTETFTGTLTAGASATFTFAATADLSAEGLHEICAWTSLATDDDVTNDEIPGCADVMHLAPVSGTGAYYIYSSTVGFEPGWMNSNSTAMDEVFGDDAWTLDYYEDIDPYTVFSESNCFIFLEASEGHWSEFESFFEDNSDLIQGWVASGGNLFINASPWEGDGGDVGFGGVSIVYPYYTYQTAATDPTHPIYFGPFTPTTSDFTGFYVAYARTTGDVTPIMNDFYCDDCYILSQKDWGDGRVFFGNMSAPEYYSPSPDNQNLRQNIIDYLKLCAPVDLGVTTLLSPDGGCGTTATETVSVIVSNFGPSTVTNIPMKFQVDGGAIVTEVADGPVPIGGTYTYTFTATANLATPGTHTLATWTDFSGDEDETNDTLISSIVSLATPVLDLGPNTTVCDDVVLNALNVGSTYLWSTGETTQTITVTTSGTYSVTVTNPTSGCSITDNITVTVNYTPVANFSYTVAGGTVTFTNESTDGASYNWSFGDGGSSTTANPSHAYATAGMYTVTLTVTNGCGSDFYSVVIEVGTAITDMELDQSVTVYPNPTDGRTNVNIALSEAQNITLELLNQIGQTVWTNNPGNILTESINIDMTNMAAGVYNLKVTGDNGTATKQIILTK